LERPNRTGSQTNLYGLVVVANLPDRASTTGVVKVPRRSRNTYIRSCPTSSGEHVFKAGADRVTIAIVAIETETDGAPAKVMLWLLAE